MVALLDVKFQSIEVSGCWRELYRFADDMVARHICKIFPLLKTDHISILFPDAMCTCTEGAARLEAQSNVHQFKSCDVLCCCKLLTVFDLPFNLVFQSSGADQFGINNKNLFQEDSQSASSDVPPALPPKTGTPTRPPPPPPGQ